MLDLLQGGNRTMKQKKSREKSSGRRGLSQTQYIAFGFFLLIMAGTLLLMLPISSKSRQGMDFLGALFTATSASCVTGLVVADTWTQWSLMGRSGIYNYRRVFVHSSAAEDRA